MVSEVAIESEKKIGHKRPYIRQRADSLPTWKSNSSGEPTSAPVLDNQTGYMNEGIDAAEDDIGYEKVLDNQTDYMNEGIDSAEDDIGYEKVELEEGFFNTAGRDDIHEYQVIK